uniref:Uncharacterized protein n=1 Tax=Digenea simplex TaxID=945030 RepID=A0A1Z1MUJ8_DIGSM|nr:hypothetical protein [Digenea simplex]ARW69492.1 hypothetical protein [Digenea simplex]
MLISIAVEIDLTNRHDNNIYSIIYLGQNKSSKSNSDTCNGNIILIGNMPDKILKKLGAFYEEKSKRKNRRKSTNNSKLTFRQQVDIVDGVKKNYEGTSDPEDPQNLEKFELAGIPIDKMKDIREKPDSHNDWKWYKKRKKCLLVGEEKMKTPNGKIIKVSEWNKMIRKHSGEI